MRETYGRPMTAAIGTAHPAPIGMPPEATPTLARTTGHIGANVAQGHEWCDRIEAALFGAGSDGADCKEPCPANLESQLGTIAERSAALSVRLSRIAEKLG